MPVTTEALQAVEEHWAVQSLDDTARQRLFDLAQTRLIASAVGKQFEIGEHAAEAEDVDALNATERLATAYELAAVENIDALLGTFAARDADEQRNIAQAGASRSYELFRTLPLPDEQFERIFHVLHLGSLAYCSDRWAELRGWLRERRDEIEAPSLADAIWEERLIIRSYDCWRRLLQKDGWNDLEEIAVLIAGLRTDQAQFEPQALGGDDTAAARSAALRLVALYHWARATELLAEYMLQGQPAGIDTELDRHFDAAHKAAAASMDASLDVLLRWLHVAAKRMAANSVWWLAQRFDSRVPDFVRHATRHRGLFELLPPQRAAVAEQGLLDPAQRAIVVDLPTSGGKTMLAELRILQALNQFSERRGWVAYVAPTRALVNQLTRRLRADLGPIGIEVEQLSSSVEIDSFEASLLSASEDETHDFDVLVVTPEKLDLIVRSATLERPLALAVMDEAHNIEDDERGLRIELLLATVRRDCPEASFLLLMPHVPNADDLAAWLGGEAGRSVQLGTSAWQPNDRVVGMFWPDSEPGRGNWSMRFRTLVTTPGTITMDGEYRIGGVRPLPVPLSSVSNGLGRQAAATARIFSDRGTSIALARDIPLCWTMAREVASTMTTHQSDAIPLVQRFLATEISADFELIQLLGKGVGVHHAGLSDEARSLIEWLAEDGHLRVLCATTGIAQGINFPVSSVFIGSRQLAGVPAREMSKRSFWNLAGRAGRIDQDPVGVVGLARGTNPAEVEAFVSSATEDLVSRLVTLLEDVDRQGRLHELQLVIHEEQWTDFRTYVAHLWNQHQSLDDVVAASERVLRNTYGFSILRQSSDAGDRQKADALLSATRQYAAELAQHPENATLADATGFAPEGVRSAILDLRRLGDELNAAAWSPPRLFGQTGSILPDLVGVMLNIPQLRGSLGELTRSGLDRRRIAAISADWVRGDGIEMIARTYFQQGNTDLTKAISNACKAIYRTLSYAGTWGLSALAKMPSSGINFETLTDEQRRAINNVPAMLYHGVSSDAAVLMRMNSVPRSIAEPLGSSFVEATQQRPTDVRPAEARAFLRDLADSDWQRVAPAESKMSGSDYRKVWKQLSGESE